jgi:chorismate synthase
MRIAFKPTATLMIEQDTVNDAHEQVTLRGKGRHDACVLPRAVPVVEAMAYIVLADHMLKQRTTTID